MVGFVYDRELKKCVIHSDTQSDAVYIRRVIEILSELHAFPPDFRFTSIQLLMNAEVVRHRDKNGGWSLGIALGDFTGGSYVQEGVPIDIWHKPTLLDGSREHWVTPSEGNRMSLVIYPHKHFVTTASPCLAAVLESLGFRIPDIPHTENRVRRLVSLLCLRPPLPRRVARSF